MNNNCGVVDTENLKLETFIDALNSSTYQLINSSTINKSQISYNEQVLNFLEERKCFTKNG